MIISDKKEVHIIKYPYAEKLNPKLHEIILEKAVQPDMGALMTEWHCMGIKEFKLIGDYARNIILSFKHSPVNAVPAILADYTLTLQQIWGQVYNEGHQQTSHHHVPSSFAFVYFVNTPKGSSPLVFTSSGKRVKAEAGNMVIFPANLFHHVPENRCKGRSVIAGNIYYKINDAF